MTQTPESIINSAQARIVELEAEVRRLTQWVNDLQAGSYITCVYCGHNYGPDDEVPTCMADVLKEHIEQCPKHPMSALKSEVERLRAALTIIVERPDYTNPEHMIRAARAALRGEEDK